MTGVQPHIRRCSSGRVTTVKGHWRDDFETAEFKRQMQFEEENRQETARQQEFLRQQQEQTRIQRQLEEIERDKHREPWIRGKAFLGVRR